MIPTEANKSGCRMGSTTARRSSSRTYDKAPISSQVVLGTTANPSLLALGWTRVKASMKSLTSIENPSSSSLVNAEVAGAALLVSVISMALLERVVKILLMATAAASPCQCLQIGSNISGSLSSQFFPIHVLTNSEVYKRDYGEFVHVLLQSGLKVWFHDRNDRHDGGPDLMNQVD